MCGYQTDRSREEAPLLLLALMMLIPLHFPFWDLQIFPFHQPRGSSSCPQCTEPGGLSTELTMGFLCCLNIQFHPRSITPKIHTSFLSVLFPLGRKCEFWSARLCSLPAQFLSISSCWMLRLLKATPGRHKDLLPSRDAKLDKAERT